MSDISDEEQTREEIVSSLVSLSETMCEKALQLSDNVPPIG